MTKMERDKLVMSVYYYCVQQAARYANHKYEREDALQDALQGAIEAAERFEPDRGFTFLTYATHWIKRGLLIGLADKTDTIKLPAQQTGCHYRNAMKDAEENGIEKAAGWHNLKTKTLMAYIAAVKNKHELSEISESVGDTREDVEATVVKHDMTRAIRAAMWYLDDRERAYITDYYMYGMSMRDIAKKNGYSAQRICQVIKRGLDKMRAKSWHLREFLR